MSLMSSLEREWKVQAISSHRDGLLEMKIVVGTERVASVISGTRAKRNSALRLPVHFVV
jgi:hypothetical protein